MTDTPRLQLPYIAASQYQKEVTHSIGLDRLDLLCQCAVLDRNLSTPPASPTLGDAYIVGPSPTGAWAGQANALALWISSQWEVIPPLQGFLCWVRDEAVLVSWSGTAWTVIQNAVTFLGLSDTPDSYTGQGGKAVVVNAGGTALDFGPATGVDAFVDLSDTPDSYSGRENQYVRVNNLASGLEFTSSAVASFLALTDTPDSYSGQNGRVVSVNSAATGVEFLPQAGGTLGLHRGALVTKSVNQNLTTSSAAVLTWAQAVYDTNSLWSVSQATRLTVPAGITKLFLLGQVEMTGAGTGSRRLRILRNGTTVAGQGTTAQPVETSSLPAPAVVLAVQTPPLAVSGGDYFELELWQDSGGTLAAVTGEQTWFCAVLITDANDQALSAAYDVGLTWTGPLPANQVLVRYPLPRAVTFPVGLSGSRGVAQAAATALTTLDLRRNDVSIGSVQFAAAALTATFTLAAAALFVAGDVLTVVAPATPDATLAGLGLALAGTKAVQLGEMGSTTFLGLTDTPEAYSGQGGKAVVVNAGATGLEFGTAAGGATTLLGLSDTPDTYSGQGGALLRVTGTATGVEFTPSVATETLAGLVELATTAEATTGTDTQRAITPAGLNARIASGGSETKSGTWTWDSAISGAVTTGRVAVNNANLALVTQVRMHFISALGIDSTMPLEALIATDILYLQEKDDATRSARYQLTAAGTNQGTYITFPVSFLVQGTQPLVNNQDVIVQATVATPLPNASETVAGIVELATATEVQTGTDAVRAVTPAGLAAKVPAGTALSVVRYAASGLTMEASPITVDAAGAVIAKATNIQPVWTWQAEHTGTTGTINQEAYQPGTGSPSFIVRKAKGTIAVPARETVAGTGAGHFLGQLYARAADNLSDTWVTLASMQFMSESMDAQGRPGGFWRVSTSPGVSAAVVEALRVTQAGNLLLGTTTHGTGLTKGLVLGAGVAPATSPPDAVQLWSADRAGVADKAGLHLRTEDGTSHVLGDLSGIGTLLTATLGVGSYQALNIKGSLLTVGQSSVQERAQSLVASSWVSSVDATRASRVALSAYDWVAAREGLRIEADGTAARIGFLGSNAVLRQTVPAAATDATTTQTLANAIRTALINLGLCA